VSTIEELLGRKSSGSCLENREYGCRGSAALITRHRLRPQKLAPTSTRSCGRSVGVVRSRTQATEFGYYYYYYYYYNPLLGLGGVFSFLIPYTSGRKVATCTQDNTNTDKHTDTPWLEWDSNPWSQCLSGRRQFIS
jgi:hypothetical protein